MRILSAVLAVALLSGCPQAEYMDAGASERYSSLVGARYLSGAKLVLHGVRYERRGDNAIDEYVITEFPGFDGPEVVTRSVLESGTNILVKRVLICKNCLSAKVKLDVEIDPPQVEVAVPISFVGPTESLIEIR